MYTQYIHLCSTGQYLLFSASSYLGHIVAHNSFALHVSILIGLPLICLITVLI